MKFKFINDKLAGRVTKSLRLILQSKLTEADLSALNFKDAVSYTFGFENHREMASKTQSLHEVSTVRDEGLTSDELALRRAYQAQRLTQFLAKHGIDLDTTSIISEWQPSSARPMGETIREDELEQLRKANVPLQVLQILENSLQDDACLSQDDLQLIRKGLKASTDVVKEWIPADIGIVATRLVNTQEGPRAELGAALFEMLCEGDSIHPCYPLAQILHYGWGIQRDDLRAKQLLQRIQKSLDKDEEVFKEKSSLISFYSLSGLLHILSDKLADKNYALKVLDFAANAGDERSARVLHLLYQDPADDSGGSDPDYPRIYHPEIERSLSSAAYYECLADKNSEDETAGNFGMRGDHE